MNSIQVIGVLVGMLAVTAISAKEAQPQEDTAQTIAYLLDYASKSDGIFIRNGKSYNGKQAAAHIQAKYDHFKDEITTPEDFIRLAATRSMLTGQPYMIKTKDGKERTCAEWLSAILEEHRKTATDKKAEKPANMALGATLP